MMENLLWLLAIFLLGSLILPWVNAVRVGRRRAELFRLERQVSDLRAELLELKRARPAAELDPVDGTGVAPEPEPEPAPTYEPKPAPMPEALSADAAVAADRPEAPAAPGVRRGEAAAPPVGVDWFGRAAVWVGGVALLTAGFFMIKYSIDSGWMTPAVRTVLVTLFGALLSGCGFVWGGRPSVPGNERIGQALSGAGVACLYFAAYASVHLYGFFQPGEGFAGMVLVTLLAVGLSLRNGAPVALMGLLGGFLTPWLMRTGTTDTVSLFAYLFVLFLGAQALCLRKRWWGLLLGATVGAYLWSAALLLWYFARSAGSPDGGLIFILGICAATSAAALLADRGRQPPPSAPLLRATRFLAIGGGLGQAVSILALSGYRVGDLGFFGLLALGALCLAVIREREFFWAAWAGMAATATALLLHRSDAALVWMSGGAAVLLVFFLVAHWRAFVSGRGPEWRALSAAGLWSIVPILFVNRSWVAADDAVPDGLWCLLAALAAGLLAASAEHLLRREAEDRKTAGELEGFAVLLFAFGLWTWLPSEQLTVALALLLAGVAVYWAGRKLPAAGVAAGPLFAGLAVLVAESALELASYLTGLDAFEGRVDGWALLGWGVGFAGGLLVLDRLAGAWSPSARRWVAWWSGLSLLFGIAAVYAWGAGTPFAASWPEEAVAGGLTALLAVLAVTAGRPVFAKRGGRVAAVVFAGLAFERVVVLHLAGAAAGPGFFFNPVLLQFGVPCLAAVLLAWQSAGLGHSKARQAYQVAAMALGFLWCNYLVADYWGGRSLFGGISTSAHLYAYSLAWLLLAIVYQAIGLWRDQRTVHVGSLILLLLTVGKAFLVDAAELEGLLRVLSFLGLGVTLIAIGFFYNRVVFRRSAG